MIEKNKRFLILRTCRKEVKSHGTKAKNKFHIKNKNISLRVNAMRTSESDRENNDKYSNIKVDFSLKIPLK